MSQKEKIRVLIVDDSVTARNLLKLLLLEDPQFEIAGIVSNGSEAVAFVEKEKPDVISMDIHMPVMNGFEATRQIMSTYPVPIVIVSTTYNPSETQLSFKALEAGALTILPRPIGPGHPDFLKHGKIYRTTLKSLSEVRVIRRHGGESRPVQKLDKTQECDEPNHTDERKRTDSRIVAIGASAGGPAALQIIIRSLPPNFPAPILIVQHIDKGFAEGFAHWLCSLSKIPVVIPKDGEALLPGHIYLASGDHHLGVKKEGIASISSASPEHGLRPAVSFLFRSVALVYGNKATAILLSGMGQDGAGELKNLKELGAYTIVQNEATSLVYGMPGEAVRLRASCRVLPPEQMVQAILNQITSLH
ncbi:MAG: chemotaxis-specific protein-glutamate methyltransferase CheB [Bacteroidales bacterium]|nr:chemotaxis-specific protein-glutamate methyltransferase CheB [Bacteroidales bacterium]